MARAFLSGQTQPALTFDTTPTADSNNPVTSGGVKTALDAKQDASTAITTSNISSQYVNRALFAVYAPDTNAVGTAALRNEKFVKKSSYSADTDDPTTNGYILWLYG